MKNNQKNITGIVEFIKSQDPDLIGLIEVDGGSRRAEGVSQARQIAACLGHDHVFKTKYRENPRISHRIPLIKTQGNAFLAKDRILNQRCHYFAKGAKRLIIEVEFEKLVIFIVHLSLVPGRRKEQLQELGRIINGCSKPVMLGGDFNVFSGNRELNDFLSITPLISANRSNLLTFPSRRPKWELDYIFHTPEITVNCLDVPKIRLSDHLPLVCDFTLAAEKRS